MAISSGRLDEAFDLLQASSERGHRDGQRLVDRLTDAFVQRLTEHLTAGRIADARHDGNQLLHLAGRKPEVADLLQQISAAEHSKRNRQQRCQDVLAAAEQQVCLGQYSTGARLLNGLNNSQTGSNAAAIHRVGQSIEARRTIVEQAAARLQATIDAENYEAAVGIIASLSPDQRKHSSIATLIPIAVTPLVKSGLTEFISGRLDRAAAIDDLLRSVAQTDPRLSELQQCLKRSRQVQSAMAAGQYSAAEAQLTILSQITSDAVWVTQARTALADAQRNLNLVVSGPLGLLTTELTVSDESNSGSPDEIPLCATRPLPQPEQSDSLLFGPAGSHFRLPSVDIPIVLHCDGDNYALRQINSGHSQSSPLQPGQCVTMNDIRFTLM